MWFHSSCTDKSQFTDFSSSKFELLKFIFKLLLHNFAKSYIISGAQYFEIVKILFHMKITIVNGSLFWFNAFLYYIKLLLNYNPIGRRAQWGALLGVPSSIFMITFVTVFISCFRAMFIQISPSSVFINHFLSRFAKLHLYSALLPIF